MTPTGGGLSVTMKVTAPAVSMGKTTFDPETLTLSPSSEHPRSTPAEGQAWTPGPLSRRDGDSTARQDRNSTGQDVEVPNVTLNPHTTREPQEHMTKDPPFLTARSTGYVVWHPSPTWETPLKSTRPQNEDPPPSSFPGPPSTPAAVTPETPACGESSGDRDPSWNLNLCEPWCQTYQKCGLCFLISNIGGLRHRTVWSSSAAGVWSSEREERLPFHPWLSPFYFL